MSTWTWTHVRIDKLTKDQIKSLIESVKTENKTSSYGKYLEMDWKDALNDWIELHKKNYNYLVNECDVNPEELTNDSLEKKLKEKMAYHRFKIECYDKVLEGKMTFEQMFEKTCQRDHFDFISLTRGDYTYVHLRDEIFRCHAYTEEEFSTVESLISYLKGLKTKSLIDFSENMEISFLTPELEEKIRNYYSKIGDGNFIVQFC